MSEKDDKVPISEKVKFLEEELKSTKKQLLNLTEELMGTITILCLPLPRGRRLELGFKQIGKIPNDILKVILERYVLESKNSDLSFDEMINPMVSVLGFERTWKILSIPTIRKNYGEYAVAKWEELAKNHACEE